jgi:ERCC4-type nuclease
MSATREALRKGLTQKSNDPKKRDNSPKRKNRVQHKVQIYIDAKEPQLPQLAKALYSEKEESPFVLGKALPIGDIEVHVNRKRVLLIERKHVSDFVSSLSTGNHFREQRARMLDERRGDPQLILMFIMEGSFDSVNWNLRTKLQRSYCEQICHELVYKYNIHVVWTKDQLGIIEYLGRVEKCYLKYGSPEKCINGTTYLNTYYVGRKRALKREEFPYMALTLIEGVSLRMAKAISTIYSTLPELLAAYEKLPSKEQRTDMLKDIQYSDQMRRIGPAMSKKIYRFLFSKSNVGAKS